MASTLLSPDFLTKLEQLELVSRKVFIGRMKGERRSKRKGTSVEFADHRNYVIGDDPRFIDWNILIRLDRLFIKLFEEEEDLHFHVLIDVSRSMNFGEPTKLHFAKQVAAALAFIGLVNLDRVMIWPFSDDLLPGMPAARGRRSLWRVLDFLEKQEIGGGSNFARSCRTFSIKNPGKGVVVVLSDLLDKGGIEAGLKYLVTKQMDVHVVQILAQEEVQPDLTGDLRLVDTEDGEIAEITVSAPLLAKYRAAVDAYCSGIKEFCVRRGITYMFATNHVSFENLVLTSFRARGLVI